MNRTRRMLLESFAAIPLLAACAQRPARPTVDLHIASDGDELAFTPDHLTCPTGADVRLFFHHAGEIIDDPHDWVLLKPGTQKAFLMDADASDESVVIPPNDKALVLAATALCAKGQNVMMEFTAPAPGDYPFVCSVPGHGETMHGILTVTA
jgi:azurin